MLSPIRRSPRERRERRRTPAWAALLIGISGVAVALALPFAPVNGLSTTVTWPSPGQPAKSTSAVIVPYRPIAINADVPCGAFGTTSVEPVTVLATGTGPTSLTVTDGIAGAVLTSGDLRRPLRVPSHRSDCRVSLRFGPDGLTVTDDTGATTVDEGEPVPEVFGFRTDLDADRAAGMTVTADVVSPFDTSPTAAKRVLIGIQLAAAALALWMLGSARRVRLRRFRRFRWRRAVWIDAVVVAVLGGWAVIGPLTVDDGWATTIARNFASSGTAGNYYRWWNADEVPFALCQHVLSLFTEISLAPLWLRLPGFLLAVATWVALSRGVLAAALPGRSVVWIRAVAALLFLTAWLPFNSGVRPEAYVALGVTATLALVWRSRTPAGLGWAALTVALTLPISPTAVAVVAPLAVFAPRIRRVLRTGSVSGQDFGARAALLCCVGAVGITAMFADQTWSAFATATDWHSFFGPSLSWYDEPDRYFYLLSGDQQGSAFKRLPVLLSAAMLPIALVAALRDRRSAVARSTLLLAGVLGLALLTLAVVPSKWSYHLGSAAGLFASFLTVAVVLLLTRNDAAVGSQISMGAMVAGTVALACAAALAFDGPNAWWQSTVYDVAWSSGPVRPAGLPLNNPLLWLGLATGYGALAAISRARLGRQVLGASTAFLVLTAAATSVAVLLGSFVAAPLRRPSGSLALMNIDRLTGARVCGLADDVEVLPDGRVLTLAEDDGRSIGFVPMAGWHPAAPPPDPVASGTSSWIWGSYRFPVDATITTGWFELPKLAANEGVALSVSGRTDGGNSLVFEFGHSGLGQQVIGEAVPRDRVAVDEDSSHPLWRSIGVDAEQIPPGADRIRIRATDRRADDSGWLAFTGPRLRSVIGLNQFLAENGPVLISWPQSFLFPCVHDIVEVSAGIAQTPRTVIESPRSFFAEDRDPAIGGTFAAITEYGDWREVPTRLAGHPEIDWGTLMVWPADEVRDAYALTRTPEVRWGLDDAGTLRPSR